jgi:hypothetical protein
LILGLDAFGQSEKGGHEINHPAQTPHQLAILLNNGALPAREGKSSTAQDSRRHSVTSLMQDARGWMSAATDRFFVVISPPRRQAGWGGSDQDGERGTGAERPLPMALSLVLRDNK